MVEFSLPQQLQSPSPIFGTKWNHFHGHFSTRLHYGKFSSSLLDFKAAENLAGIFICLEEMFFTMSMLY